MIWEKENKTLALSSNQRTEHKTLVVAKEAFLGQEKLTKACFFLLQRHYFSCKRQFDINTLKTTYTEASINFRTPIPPHHWTVSEVANLLANRWRKACIKPWGSWMCCLTTLSYIWRQRGTKTTPEEQLNVLEQGKMKPVSLRFYWNECWQLLYEFLCSETSGEINCPKDKFSDHIVSLNYMPLTCHLK